MAEEKLRGEWRVIGASVQGASHARAGLPNQDALHWVAESCASPSSILAVSDGHGSARSFRSHWGASLAVLTATASVQAFVEEHRDVSNLSQIKRMAEERLPQELVRRWEDEVKRHVSLEHSSWIADLDALEKSDGVTARQSVEGNPLIAYGATLLTVGVTESFILCLQLGDGDILSVSRTGEVSRPLPADERLFANETTSLCTGNAWRDFRVGFHALFGQPPALILLSTDGYANSFRDEAAFLRVGADIWEIIRSDGLDEVEASLETWLAEASRAGSGDDITLGILCRTTASGEVAAVDLVSG